MLTLLSRASLNVKSCKIKLTLCNRCWRQLHSTVSNTKAISVQRPSYYFLTVIRRQYASQSEKTEKNKWSWQKGSKTSLPKASEIEVKHNIIKVFGGKPEEAFKGDEQIVNLCKHSHSLSSLIFYLTIMWIVGGYIMAYTFLYFMKAFDFLDDFKKGTDRVSDYKLNPQFGGKTYDELAEISSKGRMKTILNENIKGKWQESEVTDEQLKDLSEKAGLEYHSDKSEEAKPAHQEPTSESGTGYSQMLQQWKGN